MTRRQASHLAALTVVLLVAAFGAAVAGPWEMEERNLTLLTDLFEPRTFPTVAADTPGFELAPGSSPGPGPDLGWMRYLAIGAAMGLAVTVVVWLVRRYRTTRIPASVAVQHMDGLAGSAEVPQTPDLHQGVRRARRVLDEDSAPDDAIIAAWMTLETAATGAGVRRRPAQTPTEYAVAVLERTTADSVAVRQLLDLYRRARFSQRPSTAEDVASAARWLDVLTESWETVATEPGP